MALKLVCFLVAIATVCSDVVDYEKYNRTPPPQKNFNIKKYLGNWYIVARLPSCSWVGSFGFTNMVSQYSMRPDGVVDLKETYRPEDSGCTEINLILTPGDKPGNYDSKDTFGNAISGPSVIVATDYKTFAIKRGCNKVISPTECSDPYVVVKTRRKHPSAHTFKIIEGILQHYFGLSLSSMIRVIHDDKACVQFPEKYDHHPHHPHPHTPYDHLKKMY